MLKGKRIPQAAVILVAIVAALLLGFLTARLYYAHQINEAYKILREARITRDVPNAAKAQYQLMGGDEEDDQQET